MELTEKEAHCIARLIQGALFAESWRQGCVYCKERESKIIPCDFQDGVLKKLGEAAGVDLSPRFKSYDEKMSAPFPYCRFLKNSNELVKESAREYFKECLKVE